MLLRSLLSATALLISQPTLAAPTYDFGQPGQATEKTRSIDIKITEMAFEPASVEVKAGETVRFVIHNQGNLLHEFSLGDAAMHSARQEKMQHMQDMGVLTPTSVERDMSKHDHSKMDHSKMGSMMGGQMSMGVEEPNGVLIEPGKTAELVWTFSKAGNLEIACNVPGHSQAGLQAPLTVKP